MATLEAPTAANGTNDPASPVPLDTIPVSPADGTNGPKNTNGEGAAPADDENTPPTGEKKKEYVENDQITVFHDPDNFNVKHPLMHEWTLWFTKPPSGKVHS